MAREIISLVLGIIGAILTTIQLVGFLRGIGNNFLVLALAIVAMILSIPSIIEDKRRNLCIISTILASVVLVTSIVLIFI